MMLPNGSRLGPYQVVSPLGAGGMGEVYRARDTRLKRDVALKVLPDAFAADSDRLARLQREAEMLATLNHPNIAAIYGLEQTDSTKALVLELVEGETLADRLARGPIPVEEALRIATQIAEALEAAHDRGVIHRDLKPANIKITPADAVKVLDFGLARLAEEPTSSPAASASSATIASPVLTHVGMIVGTVAYMSPEQANGRPADRRSDMWAFGCVLYEMLTGRRPFEGDVISETIAKVLKGQPDWQALPKSTPPAVRRLLRRCLTPAPSHRLRSAGDAAIDLRDAAAELVSPIEQIGTRSAVRVSAVFKGAFAVFTLLTAVLIGYILYLSASRDSADDFSMHNAEIVQLTTTGRAERPAISPDGKYVVYVERDGANFSLWLRQTGTASTVRIVAPEPGVRIWGATVSPDGAFVDYVRGGVNSNESELWRIPMLGGMGRRLLAQVHSPIEWAPDGKRFAFVRRDRSQNRDLLLIADSDATNERVAAASDYTTSRAFLSFATISALVRPPAWSPSGDRIALAAAENGDELFVVRSDGSDPRSLQIPGANGLFGHAWVGPEELVLNILVSQGSPTQLWRYSIADSSARRLTHDVNGYLGIDVSADHSRWVTSRSDIRVSVWVGDSRGAKGEEIIAPMLYNYIVVERATLAWVGRHIFFTAASTRPESETGAGYRIAAFRVTPPDRATIETITGVNGMAGTYAGDALLFNKICPASCDGGLFRADADGGRATLIGPGPTRGSPTVTPDGTYALYTRVANDQAAPWIVPLKGGEPRAVVDPPSGGDGSILGLAPDGKRVMFVARGAIVLCELPTCASQTELKLPRRPGGPRTKLLPDGSGIAYLDAATRSNIWVQPFDESTPYQLTHFADGRQIGDYGWSNDGSRLAVTLLSMPTDIVMMTGLGRSR
jgi:serine/threonine protein kinase/Tol biopolymer transport system component